MGGEPVVADRRRWILIGRDLTDESGELVESVTVGVSNVYGEPVHPGASLPSAGGVRVGIP